ncbi:MAG TPA: transketolase family protein [Aminivibrio sp.]|jgi:transketolase|uniref:transketolase family protein n=1 Tax=Aminivibrio sp. TaxID=1872489 RepID=UPI002D155FBD|nr:transketolase family protein [Aminivibrio sp.]HPF85486.1 transketolase family protein [Aminivibrio sp.]
MLINLRTAYGEELLALAKENSRVVALDADLCGSTQSVVIEKNFPERYFEMGIGEQNMISVAAGLSLTGKIPFAHSFAVFASGRPFDQIRQSVCLPKLNVKIVGSSCGLSDFGDGATHQSFEDLATMRVLPGMTVFCPADAVETKWAVRQAAAIDGPVYIRLNRNDLPVLFDEKTPFETGKPLVVKEGSQVALIGTGTMTAIAMEAAGLLETKGISARVIHLGTIKPLDTAALAKAVNGVRGIVTCEEHTIYGGLGSAVAEALCAAPLPMRMVGIQDRYGQSAVCYDELLVHYGLTKENIAAAAEKLL